MDFPSMNASERRQVTVPALDGGLAGADAPWAAADNRLREARNLWWTRGALRTRPGLRALPGSVDPETGKAPVVLTAFGGESSDAGGLRLRTARAVSRTVDGSEVRDVELVTLRPDGTEDVSRAATGVPAAACASLMLVEGAAGGWTGAARDPALLCLGTGGTGAAGRILAQPAGEGDAWPDLTDRAYIPLVMVDGTASLTAEEPPAPGTAYEGFNLLTGRFRAQFTTGGEPARYFFLPVKHLDDGEITAVYTGADGTKTTYVVPAGASASPTNASGLSLHVSRTGGYLYLVQTEYGIVRWFLTTGVTNNLEITASAARPLGRDVICSMRFAAWFGGDRSDNSGGSRLFVAGHPALPHLVRWSDVNNPLYFPENNAAWLGDAGQAVTAFAKQGERLILFKEREMYYTTYTAGSRTAKTLPDGTVVDAAANAARFPVTQLHPTIGCDCPQTIRLCDSRLVWADSDGRVYALSGGSSLSEAHVRRLSDSVEDDLSARAGAVMKAACAAAWRGHYLLAAGDGWFVCRTEGKEFAAFLSGGEGQSARPAWTKWEIPGGTAVSLLLADGGRLLAAGRAGSGTNGFVRFRALAGGPADGGDAGEDSLPVWENGTWTLRETPVAFSLATKRWDFGRPGQRKDVPFALWEMETAADAALSAGFDDGRGVGALWPLDSGEGGLRRLPLSAVRVRRLSLRLEGSGRAALGGLILPVRFYAGTR